VAQPKPEDKDKLDQVLKLVDQLSPEEREMLLQNLKLQELRREVQIGINQADSGDVMPAEEVLGRLRTRAEQRLEEKKQT